MKQNKIKNWIFLAVLSLAVFWPVIGQAGTVNLPKTGQTKCYDAAGTEITCAGTGQDGEIQAGVAWPNPRFTAGTGADADCMVDNLTGLMWPKNGNLAGTKNWNDAIDYPKTLTLCGHLDWRLPNINELESLVNAGESDTGAWLNAQGFTNVQSYAYWSSTTLANDIGGAWFASTLSGAVGYYYKAYQVVYVWPVRTGNGGSLGSSSTIWKTGQVTSYRAGDDGDLQKGISWPSSRFTDQGNSTVTDNLTGLSWTKDANTPGPSACSPGTSKTWQAAVEYVKCLNRENYLGYNDWRVPNTKELRSLSDYSQKFPALPSGHPFTGVLSSRYWSSTASISYTGYVWNLHMWSGGLDIYYRTDSSPVWPVRSGQVGNLVNLIISKSGSGNGTITGTDINCISECSAYFSQGSSVTLTATPSAGSTFTGWSGSGCSEVASRNVHRE